MSTYELMLEYEDRDYVSEPESIEGEPELTEGLADFELTNEVTLGAWHVLNLSRRLAEGEAWIDVSWFADTLWIYQREEPAATAVVWLLRLDRFTTDNATMVASFFKSAAESHALPWKVIENESFVAIAACDDSELLDDWEHVADDFIDRQ